MLRLITQPADAEIAEDAAAVVLSLADRYRQLLGEGATYGDLPESDDPLGSPVYLPGDPRLNV